MSRIAGICYFWEPFCPSAPRPPPLPSLLPTAGRCTLLAGNSSISLAGSEEQISFPSNLLCVVVFRPFSQIFPLGAPEKRLRFIYIQS